MLKYHPEEKEWQRHKKLEEKYKNVIVCDENIQSLFDAFDCFASFSSTVIYEGLLQGKKFATGGYHFCNNPKLVYLLARPEWCGNLLLKLKSFVIDKEILTKYLSFVSTKYAVSIKTNQFAEKLLKRQYYYQK